MEATPRLDPSVCDNGTANDTEDLTVIFIGSGSSSGTPKIGCIQSDKPCDVCADSVKVNSKNRRRNPSLMIQYKKKNIMIDCGKSFRDAIVDCILKHRIVGIDAVILTHSHADACFGLDEMREFTENHKVPIYARHEDIKTLSNVFPYLMDIKKATGSGYVSQLEFVGFDQSQPLDVLGLEFLPLVVEHGPNNTSLGFKINNLVYISDVSLIPEQVLSLLEEDPIELLIIDALLIDRKNASHINMEVALDYIRKLRPKRSLLIGMGHEFHYEKMNEKLRELLATEGIDVQLSHDGLKVNVTPHLNLKL